MKKVNLRNIVNKLIYSVLLAICLSASAFANIKLIRDSELENVLHAIAEPLLRKANTLEKIKFYIFDDPIPNAFTPGLNMVFLSTGLIKGLPKIEALQGVIAHELGHILSYHPTKMAVFNEDILRHLIPNAIAIGMGIATGDPRILVASISAKNHYLQRNFLKYSRDCESQADQFALKLLAANKISCQGLIDLHHYLLSQNLGDESSRYDSTHPMTQERLVVLDAFLQNHPSAAKSDLILQNELSLAITKLKAFTEDPTTLIQTAITDINSIYTLAIAHFRHGNFQQAEYYVNQLIKEFPQNPYYYELKGQIHFAFSHPDALKYYRKASTLLPNDLLIRLYKSIAGISIKNTVKELNEFQQDLLFIIKMEPDNILALRYLAILYEKMNYPIKALLTLADLSMKCHKYQEANRLATQVMNKATPNSAEWYRAQDILELTRTKFKNYIRVR